MARRQSTTPTALSEKAFGAARDAPSARQRKSSSSVSFRAVEQSHANMVVELPDFEDNCPSGEGSDGDRYRRGSQPKEGRKSFEGETFSAERLQSGV